MKFTDEESRVLTDERVARVLHSLLMRSADELAKEFVRTRDTNAVFHLQGRLASVIELASLVEPAAKNRR